MFYYRSVTVKRNNRISTIKYVQLTAFLHRDQDQISEEEKSRKIKDKHYITNKFSSNTDLRTSLTLKLYSVTYFPL